MKKLLLLLTLLIPVCATHAQTVDICSRTTQVQSLLMLSTGAIDCASVSSFHLGNLRDSINLGRSSITALKPGDFEGLTALRVLWLDYNALTSLPVGVFDGLTALERLYLDYNALTLLPVSVFNNLTKLTVLDLHSNALRTLPMGLFDGLTALQSLALAENELGALSAGLFNDLRNLDALGLNDNQLNVLPEKLFASSRALRILYLGDNALTTLPANLLAGLDGLQNLDLDSNQIETLPAGVFDGLGSLTKLDLSDNSLRTLPANAFRDLNKLEKLELLQNDLETLPAGVFDGLSSLTVLWLHHNQINSIAVGAFTELGNLRELHLYHNRIDMLPANVFDGLDRLQLLYLNYNQLRALPEAMFAGLDNLQRLFLNNNQLDELATGTFRGINSMGQLKDLQLQMNPELPEFRLSLQRGTAADSVVVRIEQGTPYEVRVPLTVTGGTASKTTAIIAKGSLMSAPITITATPAPMLTPAPVVVRPGRPFFTYVEGQKCLNCPLTMAEPLVLEEVRIMLSLSPAVLSEAATETAITVTASLREPAAADIVLTLTPGEGTADDPADYTGTLPETLTIRERASSGTATIQITPVDDRLAEGIERIPITAAADLGYIINTPKIELRDNDTAPSTITLTANFDTLTAGDPTTDVVVTAMLGDGTITLPDILTIPLQLAGTGSSPENHYTSTGPLSIDIPAATSTGTTTLQITLASEAVAGTIEIRSTIGDPYTVTPAIIALMNAFFTVDIADRASVTEGLTLSVLISISGRRGRTPAGSVIIAYRIMDDSTDPAKDHHFRDGVTSPLRFTDGIYNGSINLETYDDNSYEGDETLTIIWTPRSTDSDDIFMPASIETIVTLIDDDVANIADFTQDETVDINDAALFYYAFTLSAALGSGTPGSGYATLRATILGPLLPPDTSDARILDIIRIIDTIIREKPTEIDIINDGEIDIKDARAFYYAIQLRDELGDGTPGSGGAQAQTLRLAILGPLLQSTDDVALRDVLLKANLLL